MSRETAYRVFSKELSASTETMKGNEEMSPTYVISPLGSMINRVMIAGLLTEIDKTGSEDEPYYVIIDSKFVTYYELEIGDYSFSGTALSRADINGRVRSMGEGVFADLVGDFFRGVVVDVEERDLGAARCKRFGKLRADDAAGAGDGDDFVR